MGDSIEYCEQCENRVGCHLARRCFHAKEQATSPLDAAACSPTPETSKAWDDAAKAPDGRYYSRSRGQDMAAAMLNHSRKMERERDEARRLAVKFAVGHDVIFYWENND